MFLIKKNIEQRNPHIDIIKTHKFDIYLLIFISFNIFFIWFLLYIANIYQNYYLFYVYVFVILSIVICQNFIYLKSNKFFKFGLTILIFLIIIFFINRKNFNKKYKDIFSFIYCNITFDNSFKYL